MELRLDGRTALITGGSRGLGRAMAETFAAAGASVAVVARDLTVLDETLAALRDANPDTAHAAISADVRRAGEVARAHAEAMAACGPIDILVNNSGTSNAKPFLDIDDDDWQDDLDLKLFSAVRLCRLCIPHMRDQRWGRIINSLNVGAKAASAQTCPTSASRAAGLAMTKALASEFAPDGVLVNALITGLLVTHQWQTRWEREAHDTAFEEFTAAIGNRIPVGRMGDAQEFANLALFLASDAASYVTGTAINIDGGLTPVV
ncbi:MAG: SDR family oxidoreductase [Acidimicrobiales bacterium]|nr:SDR family oxidoreductase [Acidimicrobiales bacterium]MYG87190.1 SDR family oxidoreductase [Acidimicrobiales bacterium]MYI28538.1 SDR family oxidoreductase [Acidimicrobiales bacterium]